MKRHALFCIGFYLCLNATYAQQKINDGSVKGKTLPNRDAIIELESDSKGLLHTRVALSRTTIATPLSAHVQGMMVYNTATANDVMPGIYYNDGSKWVFVHSTTQNIIQGMPGTTGMPGKPGTAGGPGAGVIIVTNDNGTWIYNTDTDTWININGATGPKGDKGDIGATGINGLTGAKGDKGDKGDIGLQGPIGPSGAQGLPGAKGADGAKGDTGAIGPQGPAGPQGAQGLPGSKGADGDKGDKGDTGTFEATVDNGLNFSTPTNIQLGGALAKATTITTDASKTLAISGLQTGAATDKLVVVDANGVLKTVTEKPSSDAWKLLGNSGTNTTTNFVGTTDANDLVFRTNDLERLRITQTGRLDLSNTSGTSTNIFVEGGNETATGLWTTAMGRQALESLTTGNNNTAIGAQTLKNLTTGGNNVALGARALETATTGHTNVVVGHMAANVLSTGAANVIVGGTAGPGLTTGDGNTFIGNNAGTTTTTGKYNTAIGNNTSIPEATGNNQLNIANNIFGTGLSGTTSAPAGLIGIGTIAPTNTLHVKPTTANSDPVKIEGLQPGAATDKFVVADAAGNLKTVSAPTGDEPWFVQTTTDKATSNTENIYQNGNVAIGTQRGIGALHVDAAKNNPAGATPSAVNVLDDFIITPGGRIGFGYKPSDDMLPVINRLLDDKVTYQANDDLDFNYSLATKSNSQAIVHRNIISNGEIGARVARPQGTSIAAFEGHTTMVDGNFATGSLATQQRAGIVLRTGKENAVGGEIWFGTSGATTHGNVLSSSAGSWYRAIMDQKGRWAFGADPNGESYEKPSERLDVLYGGIRVRAFANTGTFNASERPNYLSADAADRPLVVDANGVLKVKATTTVIPTEPWLVQNSTTEATTNAQNIYQKGNVAIGFDASTTTASNTLHVKPSVTNTDPVKIEGLNKGTGVDKTVVIDADGVLKVRANNLVTTTTSYTFKDDDYAVVINHPLEGTYDIIITLPPAALHKNRMIRVVNVGYTVQRVQSHDGTAKEIVDGWNNLNGDNRIALGGLATAASTSGGRLLLQSDGSKWYVLSAN